VRIFLVGLPRSGTTWCARALASAPGVTYVHEPDNWRNAPYAAIATRGLGAEPHLSPGDAAPAYERLWDIAFRGGWPDDPISRLATSISRSKSAVPRPIRIAVQTPVAYAAAKRKPPSPHVLVKSVHSSRSIEWIVARFEPRVVILWRNPISVFASYKQLGWAGRLAQQVGDPPTAPDAAPAEVAVSLVGWISERTRALLDAASRHPDWRVARHEDLLARRDDAFRELAAHSGLTWSTSIEEFLAVSDRPGERYSTDRDSTTVAESWRARLSPEEITASNEVLERYAGLDVVGAAFASCIRPV